VSAKDLRRALLADPNIRATYGMFKKVTVSVLGIGALRAGTTSRLLYGGIIDERLHRKLLARGAVGDVLSYIFNVDGDLLASGLEDRLIGMPLQEHLRVPHRIGVAAGEAKADAIEGALQGGFVSVIVTDSSAALALLARHVAADRRIAADRRRELGRGPGG
jgi:DNA-binding transcriptional regulator LsrR (DeoR family)